MKSRYPVRLAVYLGSYYLIHAVFQGYLSLYFTSLGFSGARIGTVFALIALTSVFAQPAWGTLGDRMKSRANLLRVLIAAAAILAQAFRFAGKSYLLLIVLACLYSWFYTSIQPLGDSIILDDLEKTGHGFGPSRLTGCLAYAISNVLFGMYLTQGHEDRVMYCLAVTMGLTFLVSFLLPPSPGHQRDSGKKVPFTALFKNREFIRLLVYTLPLHLTMGYFYTFFSPHFTSLEGGTSALLGWAYFISATSEFVFLLLCDKLIDRFGPGKLISVSALFLTLRWLIIGTADSVPVVMASQLLHSWTFIVMSVSMAKYVTKCVDKDLHASGQMLIAIVNFGIARFIGNLGGGLLADAFGRQTVFLINSGICFATLLCFAPRYFLKKHERT